MPRIRSNNNNSSAAAVVDTAVVAFPQTAAAVVDTAAVVSSRGPLHTASQGPLSPQAVDVSDTSAAAARRVTVSDTVTAVSDTATLVPCLKSVLKYPASIKPREMLVIEEDGISDALYKMEKTQRAFYKKFLRFWYLNPNPLHRQEWFVLARAYAKGEEIKAPWKRLLQLVRDSHVALFYRGDDNDNSPRQRSVSFGAVTVAQYVLTKRERFGKLDEKIQRGEKRDRFPHRDYDKIRPRKGYFMDVGRVTARVWDSSLADANHKDWIDNGNEEALALDKQPLPRTDITFVFSAFEAAVQSTPSSSSNNNVDVPDTSSVSRQSSSVVTETTTSTSTSAAAAVLDTAATPVQQSSSVASFVVVTETTTSTCTSAAAVLDTAATPVQQQSTESSIVEMAVPVPAQPQAQAPLRRSARIAARNASSTTTATTPAAVPLRRTRRKGAVKPQGFYKV